MKDKVEIHMGYLAIAVEKELNYIKIAEQLDFEILDMRITEMLIKDYIDVIATKVANKMTKDPKIKRMIRDKVARDTLKEGSNDER
jgi:hypothetical protein